MAKKHPTEPSGSRSKISLADISPEGFDATALEAWAGEGEGADTEGGISDGSVGYTQGKRPKRYGLVLLVVLVGAALVTAVWGFAVRGQWPGWLTRVAPGGTPEITLVASENGRVLMVESSGDGHRILVETGSQAGWLLISRDDTTATNPVFSPGAERVAYFSEQNGGQIVIASVTDDLRMAITSREVEIVALQADLSRLGVCEWTPIAWAPDGQRLAFFACRELLPLSLIIVADIERGGASLIVLPDSMVEGSAQRQLQWLDGSRIVATAPPGEDSSARVRIYSVP